MGCWGLSEMTLTIELTEEQEKRLAARANGKPLQEYAQELLANAAEQPPTGAELLASWKREEITGLDAPDSPKLGRRLHTGAEHRNLARALAAMPAAARQPVLEAVAAGGAGETEYDREWVDLDEQYGD